MSRPLSSSMVRAPITLAGTRQPGKVAVEIRTRMSSGSPSALLPSMLVALSLAIPARPMRIAQGQLSYGLVLCEGGVVGMRRAVVVVLVLFLLLGPGRIGSMSAGGEFQLADPRGDDYGPGTYIYPKNRAFEPYRGLFDLLSLAVTNEAGAVRFDLTLADLRNPWVAPEGFSHQLIEVYICRRGRAGWVEPPVPGSFVKFSPDYPADIKLKAAPWDSSELLLPGPDGQPVKHQLQAGLAGRRTIRITVPLRLIGPATASWRYYVLVGSYDGFGEDNFRPVAAKPGEWHFGGGRDDAAEPQVIDILAPERGRYSQERQLSGFDPAKKHLAMLMPVGPDFLPGTGGFPWLAVLVLAGMMVFVGWWYWYAPTVWRDRVSAALTGVVRVALKWAGRRR